MKLLFLALLLLAPGASTQVSVTVEDTSGSALKDELVIIQDLYNREHEILRVLTDKDGKLPVLNLQPGLYRAIATAPYGYWQTEVKEFLVAEKHLNIALRVRPMPTHGAGDIVAIGTKKQRLRVLQANGSAASGAEVYVRDRDATLHLERGYKTDLKGEAQIELVGDPTVAVVVFGNSLTTRELPPNDAEFTMRLSSAPD